MSRLTIRDTCPRCNTTSVALELRESVDEPIACEFDRFQEREPLLAEMLRDSHLARFGYHGWEGFRGATFGECVFQCGCCGSLSIWMLASGGVESKLINWLTHEERDEDVVRRPISILPSRPVRVPDHIPDDCKRALEEAVRSYVAGAPNGAAALTRTALDLATKAVVARDYREKKLPSTLAGRLDFLVAERVIRSQELPFLKIAKDMGNDAVHDLAMDDRRSLALLRWVTAFMEREFDMRNELLDARGLIEPAEA